jgi:lipooligosaccharide transport system ATP-binding protein
MLAGAAIKLQGVTKRFGDIVAVNGLDLEVTSGECVGLLGPNGAGKTTTMRMLTAQAIADQGRLNVLGYRLPEQSKQVRAEIGVVPQIDNLDIELTPRENLEVFARLYRVRRKDRRAAVERALGMAGLSDRADMRIYGLSGGMRRRLLVARGLVHNPRLALLDEPTVGLDPQVRQQLWSMVDGLRSEGVTVLMSTHYIEEAERLADTVVIMAKGRVVASGSPAQLIADNAGREVLEVYGTPGELVEVEEWAASNGRVTRHTGPALAIMRAEQNGSLPDGVRRPANLEDAFVLLTGEEVT